MSALPTLPGYVAPRPNSAGGRASRSNLSRTARSARERRLTHAAIGAAIAVHYGRVRCGAGVFSPVVHAGKLLLGCLWGVGPLGEPTLYDSSGNPLPAGVEQSHVTGDALQPPHPWLVDAIDGYDDALVLEHGGQTVPLAYSVLRIPKDAPARIEAEFDGLAVYDSRTDTTDHFENPALWLADWLSNPVYGLGRTVDYARSEAAFDACDEALGDEARRWGGLSIDRRASAESWIETLRTYAGCIITRGPDGLVLVPDRPRAVSRHIGPEQIIGSVRLQRTARANRPTVVRVRYTGADWNDTDAVAYAPGVLAGTRPWRESVVPLPGYRSHAVAYREAVERLNAAILTDLDASWISTDEALADEIGDVVTLTDGERLDAQPLRITDVSPEGPGRWRIEASAYDAAVYSDAIASAPGAISTPLPDPRTPPPPVTVLAATEEVYQQQNGTFSSRLRVSWDASDWPYATGYRVEVLAEDNLAWLIETRSASAVTGALQELVEYTVRVFAVSELVSGEAAELAVVAQGKFLPPGNVPSVSGFEVGGEVRLQWKPAIDIDIWRYEVRYAPAGGTWAEGSLIDRVDGLRLVAAIIPAGEWDFMVKAVDSVGNYSPAEARRTITVTLDAAAFLVDEVELDAPVTEGMAEYRLGRLDAARRWVTEDGDAVATKFAGALTDYTEVLAAYNAVASLWRSESVDFGLTLAGNWSGQHTLTPVTGAPDTALELSPDGAAWDDYPSLVAKTSGRFARLSAQAASPIVFAAEIPEASIRIDATPRTETGQATSVASGPTTITVEQAYAAVKSITVTPLGTTPRTYAVDNIVVGDPTTFDVYLFDVSGNQVATDFRWQFDGV
ncbi:phage tail protein [Pseudazoarcus pumilus]|uniref:phage tail protein n=1 Tax=Pseudazoarcus pumilus TaxID=2067960 RepID=UPI0013DCEDE5|nr:phage tail protein [Pseudazoarcus pumilus]